MSALAYHLDPLHDLAGLLNSDVAGARGAYDEAAALARREDDASLAQRQGARRVGEASIWRWSRKE